MSESLRILTRDECLQNLAKSFPHQIAYKAMYSSWLGGIILDPALMVVPLDDHMVHRGDAIFEAIKCLDGRVFGLEAHLSRLVKSAEQIALSLPRSIEQIHQIILQTIRAAKLSSCLIRLYVSRGPGGFSVNPYESVGSQLYIMATTLVSPSSSLYKNGATAATTVLTVKDPEYATIKSCNYLPNVLMKKEAVDRGIDFIIGVDKNHHITEGPTENIGIVVNGNQLLVPRFSGVLRGVTQSRVLELIRRQLPELHAAEADITIEQAQTADEVMMFGTTLDVMPVVKFNGYSIGSGVPGRWSRALAEIFNRDLYGSEFTTPLA